MTLAAEVKNTRVKRDLDDWLDNVNYSYLNSTAYKPTEFALTFMNFIKLVNGHEGESHKTPAVHLRMLDTLALSGPYVANLVFRGGAKTTLFAEYMIPYLAIFRHLPGFGDVGCCIYVSDSMENGVKSLRKNIEFRYHASPFLKYWLPKASFTDNYIEFENRESLKFGMKMFGAKTGLRGTKIFGKRPPLAILDDLVADDDARSKTAMDAIKDTVYKGVNYALDPVHRKVIFNGTPFNKEDILIEAVESGAWDVNVWPVAERFPCEEKEFSSAWPDRFTYAFVRSQYDNAVLTGKLDGFYQELMLRISSAEDRLVQESEINWYDRKLLLANKHLYNFFITTDFATSAKQTADFSVISVWAVNSNGDWFWVDGICARQTMDRSINDLFRLVEEYKPMNVGIETTGQQGAFIQMLQREMMIRNTWFNFAREKNKADPGIRPTADKLSRFNLVVPWFKAGKMYFPMQLRESTVVGHFMNQLRLATVNGLKGKDDCIDTISMLAYINWWRPSEAAPSPQAGAEMWDDRRGGGDTSPLSSYLV